MLRPVLVVGGTIAGLVALFSYKTHVPGLTPIAAPGSPVARTSSAPVQPAAVSASTVPSKTATHKASPSSARTTPQSAPTTAAATQATPQSAPTTPTATPTPTHSAPSGTFTGNVVNTQYGEVQVQIVVRNGKITSANGGLPQGGDSIASNAIPALNNEVIQAQSANIQSVSGATYTSQGYIGSLQQAVSQAGL